MLPFKSALMGAAETRVDDGRGDRRAVKVQPVSTAYVGLYGIPMGRENRPLYAWYGDMELVPHLVEALKTGPIDVVIEFHPAMTVDEAGGRKAVAAKAEAIVRRGQARALAGYREPTPAAPLPVALPQNAGTPIRGGGLNGLPHRRRPERLASQPAARHNAPPMKKLFIKTYGCQMNVYDSARMAELLAPVGYAPAETPEDADMVILNTCHIREKAAEKVYSELGRLKQIKQQRPLTIAVAGCVAQAEGAEIVARAPQVDIVVGPQAYHRLPEMIAKIARSGGHALETDFPALEKFDALPADMTVDAPTAFLTVQEGCDKFCTFCVVPYTRGSEYSRSVAQIEAEARRLAARGVREITLLGQNVNAYAGEGPDGETWSLARLLHRLARIEGLARLRYTTSHPRDMGDDLIAAHGDLEALMPYLHLPVQSGSDAILDAMNRGHTADHYRALAARIRAARPDIALSSDSSPAFPAKATRISRRRCRWCAT